MPKIGCSGPGERTQHQQTFRDSAWERLHCLPGVLLSPAEGSSIRTQWPMGSRPEWSTGINRTHLRVSPKGVHTALSVFRWLGLSCTGAPCRICWWMQSSWAAASQQTTCTAEGTTHLWQSLPTYPSLPWCEWEKWLLLREAPVVFSQYYHWCFLLYWYHKENSIPHRMATCHQLSSRERRQLEVGKEDKESSREWTQMGLPRYLAIRTWE